MDCFYLVIQRIHLRNNKANYYFTFCRLRRNASWRRYHAGVKIELFFNLERPNTYKERKNQWQLAREKHQDIPKEAFMLPPVDLDALLDKKLASSAMGGTMSIPLHQIYLNIAGKDLFFEQSAALFKIE